MKTLRKVIPVLIWLAALGAMVFVIAEHFGAGVAMNDGPATSAGIMLVIIPCLMILIAAFVAHKLVHLIIPPQ
ncbi:hypothetical protein N9E91_04970 [Alphaproteobacteria bacterium]|jgi:hypothetical protein|nr:hypothetical protein [Alphaproteobacteria bacterium]NCF48273.1 hypothetical protein [Bacteroidota bacterium]